MPKRQRQQHKAGPGGKHHRGGRSTRSTPRRDRDDYSDISGTDYDSDVNVAPRHQDHDTVSGFMVENEGEAVSGNMPQGNVQEQHDLPFGKPAQRKTVTYKKSFTCYITNGVASMSWTQTAGTTTNDPKVTWNEGWSMPTGWGVLDAAMTPADWVNMNMISKRHRIKACEVEIEGMIPFQETVNTGGNIAVATASNRPNIWCYVDHDHVLPKLGSDPPTHSGDFQLPYGSYTASVLPRPSFVFNNLNFSAATLKVGALPGPTEPQRLFTLMNTGKVKTIYPGQKIKERWSPTDKTWRMSRLNLDNQNIGAPAGTNPTTYMEGKANLMTGHPANGVAGYNQPNSGVLTNNNTQQSMSAAQTYNFYSDTGLPNRHEAPPYLMLKVEPYYDSADNALNIYMQCHVHYSVEMEYEEIDKFNTIVPYNFTAMGSIATATRANFNTQVCKGTAEFANGNELNLISGPFPYNNGFNA